MYAIVRTGGKQYRVEPGDVLRLEKLDAALGTELDLTEVLAIGGDSLIVGEPTVANAKVTVVVTNQRKAPKVIIFKKKRRQGYRRLTGHRQPYTEVFVKAISSPTGTVTADGKAPVFDPEKKAERIQKLREFGEAQRVKLREEAKASGAPAAVKSKKTSAAKKKVAKKPAAGKAKKSAAKKGASKGKKKVSKTTKKK
jgi:large subunit ribosomal protein L21